ncbi:hypothetical protein [Sediminispirochaeta smaragdinae]|uniref:Uncharacterized protein n=1 Tax=Sediminispirochaeta smaragdinae (strain DSM 11293 / JCM 15392 / SEBR 4228) TaxID=573413 RepID=E1R202_SEDSS|nr:hypothetical protein [Sediminispirochaeta smaragdinae]ADK81289.1 hypothetical protein Spirs_2169 [Sediminispirochaeta smaragdinae DSM 11293]ADK81887.1 hypothetical protein Spirs_2784 [Sediminispirochaeta smaragdinae DSM 11293]
MTDKTKRIIAYALTAIAAAVLAFAELFGWDLPDWGTIMNVIVIIASQVFGIEWIPPKRASNGTGGNG